MLRIIFKSKEKKKEPAEVGQVRMDESGRVILVIRNIWIVNPRSIYPYGKKYKALVLRKGNSHTDVSTPFHTIPKDFKSLEEIAEHFPIILDAKLYINEGD